MMFACGESTRWIGVLMLVLVTIATTTQEARSQNQNFKRCTACDPYRNCPVNESCFLVCHGLQCPSGYTETTFKQQCQHPTTVALPTTTIPPPITTTPPHPAELSTKAQIVINPTQGSVPPGRRKKRSAELFTALEHSLDIRNPSLRRLIKSSEYERIQDVIKSYIIMSSGDHKLIQGSVGLDQIIQMSQYKNRIKRQANPNVIQPVPTKATLGPNPPPTTTIPTTATTTTTSATSPAQQVQCEKCEVEHCSNCSASVSQCLQCMVGFILTRDNDDNNTLCLSDDKVDKNKDDDGVDVAVIAGSVLAAVLVLVVVLVIVVVAVKRWRRNKQNELSGGCSLDLVTAERVPSSTKASQEHVYGNMIVEDGDGKHPNKNVSDNKKRDKRIDSVQSVERREIYDLGLAPGLPGDERMPNNCYDDLDIKSPETPKAYMPLTFHDDTVVYENNSSIQQQMKQQEGEKQQEMNSHQELPGNAYVNTAMYENGESNRDHDNNLSVKQMETKRMSGRSGAVEANQPSVRDRRNDIIPPPYDASSEENFITDQSHGFAEDRPKQKLSAGTMGVGRSSTNSKHQHQQQQQQYANEQAEEPQDNLYEEADSTRIFYNNESVPIAADTETVYENL